MAFIISVIVAIAVVWSAISNARTAHSQKRVYSLLSIFDYISNEYLDREFKSTDSPSIEGKKINKVRIARTKAIKICYKNYDSWSKKSDLDKKGWENKLAFELSVALERIGIAVFSGALPISILLPLMADQIIDDWILCYQWIKSYREQERIYDAQAKIPFHRRHAEWVVILSTLWMYKNYPKYEPLSIFAEKIVSKDELLPRFLDLCKSEVDILDSFTKRDIKKVLHIKIR